MIASKLSPDDYTSVEAIKLVMLYKAISPEKLNEYIIKDTLNKLRFDMAFWDNNKIKSEEKIEKDVYISIKIYTSFLFIHLSTR